MKYFRFRYWDEFATKEEIQRSGKADEKRIKQYWKYFATIEEKLPKHYLKEYYAHDGFHDSTIEDIHIQKAGYSDTKIVISLKHNDVRHLLTYSKVTEFQINMPGQHNHHWEKMIWGYGEMELLESGLWCNSVLFADASEMKIVFHKISIKRIRN